MTFDQHIVLHLLPVCYFILRLLRQPYTNKTDYFQDFNLYYINIGNRYINCDLAHRRLDNINKKLTRKFVTEMSTRLILKEKESGNADRYNECITN